MLIQNKEGNPTNAEGADGDNVGIASTIWACAECTNTTVVAATESTPEMEYKDLRSDAESDKAGIDYFDLNRTSDEVNSDLNSQKVKIVAGSYNYVTMSFLGSEQGTNNKYVNTKWAGRYADCDAELNNCFTFPTLSISVSKK